MEGEIIYRFVRGQGWVAGYKDQQPIDVESFRILTATDVNTTVHYYSLRSLHRPMVWRTIF